MNIHWELEQGTDEWFNARAGLVSASCFGEIFTPTTLKAATGAKVDNYRNKLIAERLMGKASTNGFQSDAMARGHEIEGDARLWYEMAFGCDVAQVGIIEDGAKSCSPDGLIVFDKDANTVSKGLEIKCPLAHTHVSYLLKGSIPNQYIPQLQGSMFVTGADEWDFLSYHPDLEPLLITVKRDEEWIAAFDAVYTKFIESVLTGLAQLTPNE